MELGSWRSTPRMSLGLSYMINTVLTHDGLQVLHGYELTFALLSDAFILIPRLNENDMIVIDLTQLKPQEQPSVSGLSDIPRYCDFELPPLQPHWTINHLEMRYNPPPTPYSPGTPPVPFRPLTKEMMVLLVVGINNMTEPHSNFTKYHIRGSDLMEHIASFSFPNAPPDRRIPWATWGPRSCCINIGGSQFATRINWSRNVCSPRYVQYAAPSSIVYANFNQLKLRKLMANQEGDMNRPHNDQLVVTRPVDPITSPNSFDGFLAPFTVSLMCRWGNFGIERKEGEIWTGVLLCDDAIVITERLVTQHFNCIYLFADKTPL